MAEAEVYTIKSNARRACRRLGLDPDGVVALDGGRWALPTPPAIEAPPVRREDESKGDFVFRLLSTGWRSVDELRAATGWLPHTLRARLATGSRARGLSLERQRVDGITSYRQKQKG